MATIYTRRRADGSTAYTVRIRLKREGVIVHEEARTFDGRIHKRRDVERWAMRREDELRHPDAIRAAQASHLTLGAAIQRYVTEYGGADAWGRSKRADLARLQGMPIAARAITQIRPHHLVDHVRERRAGGAGPATAGNDLTWLRVLFRVARPAWGLPVDVRVVDDAIQHCREQRLIERAGQRSRRPTREEMDALLDWFTRGDGRLRIPMAEVVLFAMFSARRESEICLLRRADLNCERRQILVRDVKDPRVRGRTSLVSLTDEAMAILERQPAGDLFFPYNPTSVAASFTRACKMLGIDDLHFHDLRHECASWLFERGWTIPQVAQVTGHRTWQVLQRYTHLSGPEPRDVWAGWAWRPAVGAMPS